MSETHENLPVSKFESSPPSSSTLLLRDPLQLYLNSGSGSRHQAPLLDKAVKKQIDLELGEADQGVEDPKPTTDQKKKRRGKNLFYPAKLRPGAYRREVARRLVNIAEQKMREAQDPTKNLKEREEALELGLSMAKKAERYKLCGQFVWYRQCQGCGAGRAETGELHSPGKPCQGRTCEVCGRVNSEKKGKELHQRILKLATVAGYSLRHIVLTIQYRPWLEEDISIEAYRNRIVRVKETVSKWWKNRLKKDKGSALYEQIEVSPSGAIHVHLLHYGPFVAKAKLEGYLRSEYPNIGFTWIEQVKSGDERRAVLEVTKYVTKAHSALNEDAWLEGSERLHPELAARIEAATYMLKLTEHFGALRGKLETEETEEETLNEKPPALDDDQAVACTSCGVQGDWGWDLLPTEEFIRQCHARGENAFRNSRQNRSKKSKSKGPAP